MAGSSKCTTKQLSSLLIKVLTVIKTGSEKYCGIKTSHTGVNNMWILKNSTNLRKESKRKLARKFSLSYRYTDDLTSFNNKRFKEFISDIYPKEFTISETTESTSVASYLDLLSTRDKSNNITTKLDDKRDAFGFHILNFPFMSSNIPSATAHGVISAHSLCPLLLKLL